VPINVETTLKSRCGWCGKLLRDSPDPKAVTSHGMCSDCVKRFEDTQHGAAGVMRDEGKRG